MMMMTISVFDSHTHYIDRHFAFPGFLEFMGVLPLTHIFVQHTASRLVYHFGVHVLCVIQVWFYCCLVW